MERQQQISLLTLPTELLHRICDFLDAKTMLLSLRPVCAQLHAMTASYHHYKVYCRSTASVYLCRLIRPENIVSLGFGDSTSHLGYLDLFLHTFNIDQFTRLRSLTLHKFRNGDLQALLYQITLHCHLTSFAMYSEIPKDAGDTLLLLSSTIAQPTLRRLVLRAHLSDIDELAWPTHCNIEQLSIGTCTMKQLCLILQSSARLQTLIMDDCYAHDINGSMVLSSSYQQLTSLTLNDVRMTMDKLELLLSLVPSLVHLDLASAGKPFEFIQRLSRWETFLQSNLTRLCQLEFCIFCYGADWSNFDSVIDAFRMPFWLQEKRWFVTCQFRDDWTSSFTIFTSPEPSVPSNQIRDNFDKIVCRRSSLAEN